MEEGVLPRTLNAIGAAFSFFSAILGGLLQFPSCFLPGSTFPLAVGVFLLYEVLSHHPPSSALPSEGLPWVFGAIHEGKKSGLAIGIIFTLASGVPALVFFFLLHEVREALSMGMLCIGIFISCIVGTLMDRWEIEQAIRQAD